MSAQFPYPFACSDKIRWQVVLDFVKYDSDKLTKSKMKRCLTSQERTFTSTILPENASLTKRGPCFFPIMRFHNSVKAARNLSLSFFYLYFSVVDGFSPQLSLIFSMYNSLS